MVLEGTVRVRVWSRVTTRHDATDGQPDGRTDGGRRRRTNGFGADRQTDRLTNRQQAHGPNKERKNGEG